MLGTLAGHVACTFFCLPILSFLVRANRFIVTGREYARLDAATLYLANHRSFIDPFAVSWATFGYAALWHPRTLPYAPIAAELVTTPLRRFILYNCLHCIPVTRGIADAKTHERLLSTLRRGAMILFPEGGISPDGWMRESRLAPGRIVCDVRPTVIPVFLDGTQDVLPVGVGRPRLGKTIWARLGPPLDFGAEAQPGSDRSVWKAVSARVTAALRDLERQHYAEHPERTPSASPPEAPA